MRTTFALLLVLCSGAAWAAPAYKSADFGGGVQFASAVRLTNAGYTASLFNTATPVLGQLIYDAAVPVLGNPLENVFSIGAIDGVPDSAIFELNIGPMQFRFGDAGIQGGPAISYNSGVFSGFFFVEDFVSPNGSPLTLAVNGGIFTVTPTGGFSNVLSGFIDIAGGLSNVQDFTPPAAAIPEPESWALMLAGIGLLGFAARRRKG